MSTNARVPRILVGLVLSSKMDKTVAIRVERQVLHPLYKKYIRRSIKLLAHDETNACMEGDLVAIQECRPISKRKSWRVKRIVTRAAEA